jgi:L-ribulose-5-phosphate 3-epimerase
MNKIGMMQGRITTPNDDRIQFFPVGLWKTELDKAAKIGFDCIEWLYDLHDAEKNPISTDRGIEEVKSVLSTSNIQIRSLCAHCFIEKPLVGANDEMLRELLTLTEWLFLRAKKLDISRIILPMEDSTDLNTKAEFERQINWMNEALKIAEKTGIEIAIETTLPPSDLANFLNQIPHPLMKVNYDIGNSTGMGYKIEDEFNAYGDRIGSIHIKDKLLNGPTVAIGNGDSDFSALNPLLLKFDFKGDIVLESARGDSGDEFAWAKRNLNFVLNHLGRN